MTTQIDIIDSNIILNDDFKKNVAIPYFKDIYKDLAAQSDNKSKGINKVTVLNVSNSPIYSLEESSLQRFELTKLTKLIFFC